jgi:hypothetical protein
MYKEMIGTLAFVYGFICRGRGKLGKDALQAVANGAHVVVAHAPAVLGSEDEQDEDRKDLALAEKMDEQIEEAATFLMHLEIV